MLTAYGKLVRKHRIDQGMTLREMAAALRVTPAFLSATETGRKAVPKELREKIADLLDLAMNDRAALTEAANASRTEYRVRLKRDATSGDREVASMFARQFPELSDNDKDEIRRILAGRKT